MAVMNTAPSRARTVLRYIAASGFIIAGALHFVAPGQYQKIIPPQFPAPAALVAISGVAEIAGGIGLLIPPLRKAAVWGLIALLIAVFPANIYMATSHEKIPNLHIPPWLLWLRLPMQILFIVWIWYVRPVPPASSTSGRHI